MRQLTAEAALWWQVDSWRVLKCDERGGVYVSEAAQQLATGRERRRVRGESRGEEDSRAQSEGVASTWRRATRDVVTLPRCSSHLLYPRRPRCCSLFSPTHFCSCPHLVMRRFVMTVQPATPRSTCVTTLPLDYHSKHELTLSMWTATPGVVVAFRRSPRSVQQV